MEDSIFFLTRIKSGLSLIRAGSRKNTKRNGAKRNRHRNQIKPKYQYKINA
jgi:hypothetical protein